jgi:hypothetical protein
MNAIVQFLKDDPIRETREPRATNGFLHEGKAIWLLLNRIFCVPKRTEKIPRQLRAFALIAFSGGRKFNVGFTMQNSFLHSIAA